MLTENARVDHPVNAKDAPRWDSPLRITATDLVSAHELVAGVVVKSVSDRHHQPLKLVVLEADKQPFMDCAHPVDHDERLIVIWGEHPRHATTGVDSINLAHRSPVILSGAQTTGQAKTRWTPPHISRCTFGR
jgi:hypothetical protein